MSQRNRRRTKKLNNRNNNNHHNNIKKSSNTNTNNKKYKCDCKHCNNELVSSCKQYIINNVYNNTSPYRLRRFHFTIDLILFIFGALYIVFVPYTKIEESFNTQSTHDMLFYGYFDTAKYNHNNNDILMPKTFVSSLFLSLLVYPWKFIIIYILPFIVNYFDSNIIEQIHFQQQCQYLIRFALLFVNIIALSKFRQSFVLKYFVQETDIKNNNNNKYNHAYQYNNNKRYNKIIMIQKFSLLFSILIVSQFHFLFYSSRLLPNCLTLPCITIAFANYFEKQYNLTFIWLMLSTIIFQFHTIIIIIPFMIIIILFKIQKKHTFKILSQILIYAIITSLSCIIFTILIDSWFWNRFKSIKWVQFELFWYNYNTLYNFDINVLTHYWLSFIPKILFLNIFFMFFSIFKMHPILLIYEFANRYSYNKNMSAIDRKYMDNNSHMNICKLILLFIDLDSLYLLTICFIFIFFNSFLSSQPIGFIYCIIPPCTLLSCIGCIRLFTLWGFRGFINANYNLLWYKNNLYIRQKELYYLWIPNNLLISLIAKKILSFDKPFTCIGIKKYFRKIFKEIPMIIFNSNTKIKLIPLIISIIIKISIITTWYNVYEESYNYPGGVAITVFPKIVKNYKINNSSYTFIHNNNESYEEEEKYQQIIHQYKPIQPKRKIHSKRGDPMNTDYKTIRNASITDNNAILWSNEYINNNSEFENEIVSIYDNINCVHIGTLATNSGVSPFMIPSFYNEFRFTTLSLMDQIEMDQYININDPCNIYEEMYSKICENNNNIEANINNWDDDIYDEEYFDKHDDYLNQDNNTQINCYSTIDYKYPIVKGFDYLITEHSYVPGYILIPNGIIYSQSIHINFIHYLWSFIKHTNKTFLQPTLYVLKRQKDK